MSIRRQITPSDVYVPFLLLCIDKAFTYPTLIKTHEQTFASQRCCLPRPSARDKGRRTLDQNREQLTKSAGQATPMPLTHVTIYTHTRMTNSLQKRGKRYNSLISRPSTRVSDWLVHMKCPKSSKKAPRHEAGTLFYAETKRHIESLPC